MLQMPFQGSNFFLGGDAPKPPYKSRAFGTRPPPPPPPPQFPKVSATVNDVMKQCISLKNTMANSHNVRNAI
jgi:hypothetical protein